MPNREIRMAAAGAILTILGEVDEATVDRELEKIEASPVDAVL